MGGHNGRAATVQLATQDTCYIVDLSVVGMPAGLRALLESASPIKVCHGFTCDQINLIEQYGLDFSEACLFDTEVAANSAALGYDGGKSVVDILDCFACVPQPIMSEMRKMKKKLGWVDFFRRPLSASLARYACLDVIFLLEAFKAITHKL